MYRVDVMASKRFDEQYYEILSEYPNVSAKSSRVAAYKNPPVANDRRISHTNINNLNNAIWLLRMSLFTGAKIAQNGMPRNRYL